MSYRVESSPDPAAFLRAAGTFLGVHPVEHSVLLTNAAHGRRQGIWSTVVHDGSVVAASMVTPPHPLQVSLGADDDIRRLADHHHEAGRSLPGVGGMRGPAEAFADRWRVLHGSPLREGKGLGVFVCDVVAPPVGVGGSLRPADQADTEQLAPWAAGYALDTGEPLDPDALTWRIAQRRLWVWQVDDRPVSMAALTSREHGYSRVGFVYTPPESRARGYASACVAELVGQEMRDGGRCMLYTDLANATSNRIYAAIGFRRIGDAVRIHFG